MTKLYKYYDGDSVLLYVSRHNAFLNNNSTSWRKLVARVDIETFTTREKAVHAESTTIKKFKPKFNLLVAVEGSMSADEYRRAIDQLGWSQTEAAKRLEISVRSSHGYATGAPIRGTVAQLLRTRLREQRNAIKGAA